MGNSRDRLVNSFSENMRGGAFIYRASDNCELLYANADMVRLFECDDYDDFLEYTGGSLRVSLMRLCFRLSRMRLIYVSARAEATLGTIFLI